MFTNSSPQHCTVSTPDRSPSDREPARRLLLFLVRVVDRLDYFLRLNVFEKLREQIPHLDSRTPMFVFDNRQRSLYLVIIIGSVIFHQSECCVRGRTRCIQKTIERFHMTSRQQYWCSKTMKGRPCWCSKQILWELNSFLM